MSLLDCLAIGSSAFDLLLSVERVPRSDERVSASSITSGGGGPAATAAVAMARLGLRTALVSAVGADDFGAMIVAELNRQSVATDRIQVLASTPSTISAVLIETSGHRSMAVFGGCIAAIDLEAIDFSRIAEARCVHLDGNNPDLADAAARHARALGVPVSLDGGNIRPEALQRLLPNVDIYIPDEQSVARQLGPMALRDACRRFWEQGPALVCITRAEHGSIAFDGETFIEVPAYTGVPIVDTTGAGDNFHGAFLFGHLAGWPLAETLRFSNVFAALCCRAVGGRSSVPSLAETRQHMLAAAKV